MRKSDRFGSAKHSAGDRMMVRGGVISGTTSAVSNVDSAKTAQDAWLYTTLAAAESSGDPWADGDTIRITDPAPDVDFVYASALDTNGHSGLRHKDPFDDASLYATTTLANGEGPGTDPDTWDAKWVEVASFASKDAALDRSRFTLDSNSVADIMNFNPATASGHSVSFFIIRDFTSTGSGGAFTQLECAAYVDGSSSKFVQIRRQDFVNGTNFIYGHSSIGYSSTGVGSKTSADWFIYVKGSAFAIWDGASLIATAVPATRGSVLVNSAQIAGTSNVSNVNMMLKTTIVGSLSA